MSKVTELDNFNTAMDTLLRADPKAVKDEMEREQQEQAKERSAKGEKKRGRKKRSTAQDRSRKRCQSASELHPSNPRLESALNRCLAELKALTREGERKLALLAEQAALKTYLSAPANSDLERTALLQIAELWPGL